MEMKFSQERCRYLKPIVSKTLQQELTQEVRLPDGMPDIGRVLAVWGTPVIRGKEWSASAMRVNGGVTANILYAPEEDSQLQIFNSWIPFQLKWDLPASDRDGLIIADARILGMDARSTSARKLMLRCDLHAFGKALIPAEDTVCKPADVPQDVQVLINTYPVELPVEFGEKQLHLEEELVPDPKIGQILRCDLTPLITEKRIIASRLVFRGVGKLDILHLRDGMLGHYRAEIPFSQYADLDTELSQSATAEIMPILTNLVTELIEDKLRIDAAMSFQYLVYDRRMVEVAEDAFSPLREVTPQYMQLRLPARLDQMRQNITVACDSEASFTAAEDVRCSFGFPEEGIGDDVLSLRGNVQILHRDDHNTLSGTVIRFTQPIPIQAEQNVCIEATAELLDDFAVSASGSGTHVNGEVCVTADIFSDHGISMIQEMELGQLREPDADRPSMILRRTNDQTLWQIAKCCGSSVDSIMEANDLLGEPESERLLLIPIL